MLFRPDFVFLGVLLAASPVAAQVPGVMYHAHPNLGYVESTFREHMDFLVASGFHSITMDQFYDWHQNDAALPLRPIMLTVDDNYIDGYTGMYPIFAERGLVATNFTHTLGIGIGAPKASWAQVREMDAAGVFLVESHSRRHPDLTTQTQAQLDDEIFGSRQDIIDNANGKVSYHFCYPYGRYNQAVIDTCIAAGYRTGLTTIRGLNFRDTPLFELRRWHGDGKTLEQFKTEIAFNSYPPLPETGWILDDSEPHAYYDPAAWTLSASPTGFFHTGNRVRAAAGTATMRWAAILPETGTLAVRARWSANSGRASNATYTVRTATGDVEVVVDQRLNGGQWVELGVFDFAEDEPVEVFLGGEADGILSADAIWFAPHESATPQSTWAVF